EPYTSLLPSVRPHRRLPSIARGLGREENRVRCEIERARVHLADHGRVFDRERAAARNAVDGGKGDAALTRRIDDAVGDRHLRALRDAHSADDAMLDLDTRIGGLDYPAGGVPLERAG